MVNAKKIFSISIVKNEMDIIESFVRYNSCIFDGMIILDNKSSDATVGILNSLKNEGRALYIIDDDDHAYNQAVKTNRLLEIAVREFDADVIIPLDADEFLVSSGGGES